MKYGLPVSLHCKRTPAASSWPPAFLPPGFHIISQSPSLGPLNHPLLYLQIGLEPGLQSPLNWWRISMVVAWSRRLSRFTLSTLVMKPGYSHVSKGNFSQQQQTDRVSLRCVAVVRTFGYHVGEIYPFSKHVACLES